MLSESIYEFVKLLITNIKTYKNTGKGRERYDVSIEYLKIIEKDLLLSTGMSDIDQKIIALIINEAFFN